MILLKHNYYEESITELKEIKVLWNYSMNRVKFWRIDNILLVDFFVKKAES